VLVGEDEVPLFPFVLGFAEFEQQSLEYLHLSAGVHFFAFFGPQVVVCGLGVVEEALQKACHE